MPTIEISEEVRALIREFAHGDDESDTAVLERILCTAKADRDAALRAYEQAEQDISSTN